jgi:hypothetical protein
MMMNRNVYRDKREVPPQSNSYDKTVEGERGRECHLVIGNFIKCTKR